MMLRATICVIALCLSSLLAVAATAPTVTELVLTNHHETYVVPDGRIWKMESAPPWKGGDRGIGTADIYIEGQIFIGPEKDLSLSGTFDLVFSKQQQFPIWLLAGTKIGLGDSRRQLLVKEYVDN